MNNLLIIRVGDWAVLYVNGKEKLQGHDIDLTDVADYCPIESISVEWADGTELSNYVEEHFEFPETFEETINLLKEIK